MAESHFVILCVDDEPGVLKPIEIMLQRRGFRVVTAQTGASAIELFRQIKFDAVILDYSMPGLSGGEVAQALREENPSIPIILHTGYKEIADPLLANVTCTLPKGSLSFLMTKLNDLLHVPESERQEQPEVDATPEGESKSAHVA
ncbi:MAG TPA: response regulator [Terriglobales bacterium]|nr:response regulator [Terriglobales bacterium]